MAIYTKDIVGEWNHDKEEDIQDDDVPMLSQELAYHIPTLLSMYQQYGDAIDYLHQKTNAPASECMDVIIANIALYEEAKSSNDENQFFKDMISIYETDKELWRLIGMEEHALAIYQCHREKAKDVLMVYAPDGITNLIVGIAMNDKGQLNKEVVFNCIEALSRFKAMSLHVMSQYKEDHRFLTAIKNDFRSIPYLLRYKKDGLIDLVKSDWKGYIEEELDEKGEYKDDSWYENLPAVGGLIKAASDGFHGYPITWEEIGWAAYDVVELGLVGASFGTASAASAAIKVGVKAGGKSVAKKATRLGLRGSNRTKAITNFNKAKNLKGRSKFFSGKLSSRAMNASGFFLKLGKTSFSAGKRMTSSMWKSVRSLSPAARKRYIRLTAILMVSFELYHRTLPNLDTIIAGLMKKTAQTANKIAEGLIKGFTDAMKYVAQSWLNKFGSILSVILASIFAILGGLLLYSFFSKPQFKKKTL